MAFLSITHPLTYAMTGKIGQSIRQALELLPRSGKAIHAGDSVAVKVNIVTESTPDEAACTHPEIVRALIQELQSSRCPSDHL